MKLAELLVANFRLLDLLPGFGLGLGMEELTVEQACRKNDISLPLFLMVCNVYSFEGYMPDGHTTEMVPAGDLLDFIEASHREYREIYMPRIFGNILHLAQKCPEKECLALVKFCNRYEREILHHFDIEERELFPQIRRVLTGGMSPHELDIEEPGIEDLNNALSDLQNIIIKYLPGDIATLRMFRGVLVDLALFDIDTDKHIILEDILVTKLRCLKEGTPK